MVGSLYQPPPPSLPVAATAATLAAPFVRAAPAEAQSASRAETLLLVQEYVPARGGTTTRVETLGGRFLYAIDVASAGDTFDLCLADVCAVPGELSMTAAVPPPAVIAGVEAIASAMSLDVGGIEYMIDDRDGAATFYDINVLSNFAADPLPLLGYDPHERLVDFLVAVIEGTRS